MLITRKSQYTGVIRTFNLSVTQEQLDRHDRGGLIQEVMPELPKEWREFIMTGITPDEWLELFPPEEDEEE